MARSSSRAKMELHVVSKRKGSPVSVNDRSFLSLTILTIFLATPLN